MTMAPTGSSLQKKKQTISRNQLTEFLTTGMRISNLDLRQPQMLPSFDPSAHGTTLVRRSLFSETTTPNVPNIDSGENLLVDEELALVRWSMLLKRIGLKEKQVNIEGVISSKATMVEDQSLLTKGLKAKQSNIGHSISTKAPSVPHVVGDQSVITNGLKAKQSNIEQSISAKAPSVPHMVGDQSVLTKDLKGKQSNIEHSSSN